MEPIPETTEAVEEFGPFYEGDVLEELRAALDALQYLADGPCLRGVEANRVVEFSPGKATDEADWQIVTAARRARVSVVQVAETVIALVNEDNGD